jgi:hypothetical protein
MDPLTSVEVQLLSRSRPSPTNRVLLISNRHPHVEVEAAESLVEKGYIQAIHTPIPGTWYKLTPTGHAYFTATWPHRKDTP